MTNRYRYSAQFKGPTGGETAHAATGGHWQRESHLASCPLEADARLSNNAGLSHMMGRCLLPARQVSCCGGNLEKPQRDGGLAEVICLPVT